MAPKKKFKAPCDFGTVSIGVEMARLPIKINRSRITLERADELFSNKQLQGKAKIIPKDSDDNQMQIPDIMRDLEGMFESKRFGVNTNEISASLSIPKSAIDLQVLSEFATRSGQIELMLVGDIMDEEGEK